MKAMMGAAKEESLAAWDLARLFKASEAYREDYQPVQAEASKLGQFGARSDSALQSRELMHYARRRTWTRSLIPGIGDGARAGTKEEVRAFTNGLRTEARNIERRTEKSPGDSARVKELRDTITRAWDNQTVPLRSHEIVEHLNGPEGNGWQDAACSRRISLSRIGVLHQQRTSPIAAER